MFLASMPLGYTWSRLDVIDHRLTTLRMEIESLQVCEKIWTQTVSNETRLTTIVDRVDELEGLLDLCRRELTVGDDPGQELP